MKPSAHRQNQPNRPARSFQGFVNVRDNGALLGPWNPWLHHPKFGEPIWD
jgi:hypothetical protein